MIDTVEKALLESLRKGLSELVPPENIIIGQSEKKRSVSLVYKGFTVEEQGIGGSGGVKKEEVTEKFDADGIKKDFSFSRQPFRPLISVVMSGTERKETDDYTVDYEKGILLSRIPPEKGKEAVIVSYYVARAMAETRNIKFTLTYSISIESDDMQEKNRITLEVIRSLYREKTALGKKGISDIRLIRGFSEKEANIIEYQIETSLQIEIPIPSIEKIEIGKR